MPKLPAKFASAIVLGVMATAASTAQAQSAPRAADSCLLEPSTDTALQGKHWYYRIERGTGRKCWYLRDPDDKTARTETPNPAPAEKPESRRAETAPSRSISDAHAEIAPPRARVPNDPPAPAAVPSIWQAARSNTTAAVPPAANAGPPPLTPRWPQAADPAPAANPPPQISQSQAPQAPTSLMAADATAPDTSANSNNAAAQTLPPPDLAAAPVERNTGSLHQLMLVAVGALALAGLTGSAVYRLGRRRKRQDWLRERSNWQSLENPREPPWVDPQFAVANSNVPDLDEVKKAKPALQLSPDFEPDESGDRVEKIEDFLARLTKQLHDELEGTGEKKARAAS